MFSSILATLAGAALVSAHTVITYPGWRGDNLITNATYPYGMQWVYPCGGIGTTTNRTYWPITGGAVAVQPGWFQGHAKAFFQINLGYGTDGPDNGPMNMSNPMVSPFQILGPSKAPWPGTICLPQVPLPSNAPVQIGDNATIQVVETAVHGAALYSCVDITFVAADDPRLAEVNETNCFNTSTIGFADIYTITTKDATNASATNASATNATSGAEERFRLPGTAGLTAGLWVPLLVGGLWALL